MNRQILVVLSLAALVAGTAAFLWHRPEAEGRAPATVTRSATAPSPRASTPARSPSPSRPIARPLPAPEPAPAPDATPMVATLRVDSDVPGAQVFIDRTYVGATPLTILTVTPGRHQISVSADGYDVYAESLDLEPGPRDLAVRFREVRLNARLDVVHRHRLGSCRGTLIATPQGLRYDTTDRDDLFTTSLPALDELRVGYIEKTLKVGPIGARQYTFTPVDGDADALLVFGRDVNRARERLRAGATPVTP